ncbi:MAG: P-loop NTPase [Sedimentisphaerales bacterium]|nr:P-loop NTPase [Sedimentisphaerales bacterium]
MEKQIAETEQNFKKQMEIEQQQIRQRMGRIKHKILVLSGKGGVGKSTVAVNLAASLALNNSKVGLLDIDIHGPSIPRILNLEDKKLTAFGNTIMPVPVSANLVVMSIGFMLKDKDDPVIWRGPMKYQVIKQFLKDVEWSNLDYLIVDSPPGTGDEPLSIAQLIEKPDGAIIVTTPQQLAITDVRKAVSFCRQLDMPVIGVIENMSGFICPKCGEKTDIFKSGGGENMALEMNVPFLGRIPIDPQIVNACDSGEPYIQRYSQSHTAKAFNEAIKPILALEKTSSLQKGDQKMRVAIPINDGKLSQHFGHCETFAVIDTQGNANMPLKRQDVAPPPHEPGLLPKWLHDMGVNVIIAGGMGQRAKQLFDQNQIEVVIGAPVDTPENLVSAYLNKTLQTGDNICDH